MSPGERSQMHRRPRDLRNRFCLLGTPSALSFSRGVITAVNTKACCVKSPNAELLLSFEEVTGQLPPGHG